MGNSETAKKTDGLVEHDRIGTVSVSEVNNGNDDYFSVMEFTRQMNSEKEYQAWKKEISRIEDSETRETILLPEKHSFVKAGLCGSSGTVHLTYENFPFVLIKQILNRKEMRRNFNEHEMWYLLYNIVRAGNKFEKLGQKVGDISPYNVLINDDGQIKVIATCSIPYEIDNFQRLVESRDAKVYLAPQELVESAVQKGEYPTHIKANRAEIFSIGLTILSSGVLEDCRSIYENYRVNDRKLNEYLEIFRETYSNYLFTTVVSMLKIAPENRRSVSDIYNELYPHEEQILDLEPFPDYSNGFPQQQQQQQGRPVSNYSYVPPQSDHSVHSTQVYRGQQLPPVQNTGYGHTGYRASQPYGMR